MAFFWSSEPQGYKDYSKIDMIRPAILCAGLTEYQKEAGRVHMTFPAEVFRKIHFAKSL